MWINRRSFLGSATAGALLAPDLLYANPEAMAAEAQQVRSGHPREPMFSQPFIDIDEWRDKPVRHRYVHGGFKGTDTLFSIYLPPKEQYQGRFFQPVAAVSGDEKSRRSSRSRQTA